MTPNTPYAKIVILGHTGFIGSWVMRKLQEFGGGIEVLGYSTSTVDLTRWEEVQTLADNFNRQTAVIMCAGIKKQVEESLDAFHQNMAMTHNLARLLRKYPVNRFVYFSSGSVYGENLDHLEINEQTPVNPFSYYGIAKYASEGLFNKVSEEVGDMSVVVFRPSLVYGPGDEKEQYGPSAFAKSIISRGSETLWGDGSELRDFIFVEDVAELTRTITLGDCEGVYNLASGQTHSFKDVVDTLKSLCRADFRVGLRPRTRQKVDQGYDNGKLLTAVPNFTPTGFAQGIGKTLFHIRSTFDERQPIVDSGQGESQ